MKSASTSFRPALPDSCARLTVFPVKGCRGIRQQESLFDARGLLYDREWLICDANTGRMLTQRQDARLATIATSFEDGWLVLAATGSAPLRLLLAQQPGRASRTVSVWDWTGEALDEGDEAAAWLSTILNPRSLRLVRFDERATRSVDAAFAPGHITRFSDGFPFLLVGAASVADLNRRLASPIPTHRFRANVVVSGSAAWAEDTWDELSFAGAHWRNAKPCSRCKVPCLDQLTGEEAAEPTQTLHTFRRGADVRFESDHEQWRGAVFVGVNLVAEGEGVLRVGDAVSVLTTRAWEKGQKGC